MNNNEFKPGQSINTDDAMNDMPTFAERVKNNVPEALEYLNQHPELKQKLTHATSLLESLSGMSDEELEAEAEKSGTFLSTVETFNEITRRNAERAAAKDELETRKLDSNLDNREENGVLESDEQAYKRQMEEINAKYGAEQNAENILVASEVDNQRETIQLEISDLQKALEGLEMQKDDGNIWGEEYDKQKTELEARLANAQARLEAISGGVNAQEATNEEIEKALADKLDDLDIRRLDGELSPEEYAEEVAKAQQAAAEGRIDALSNRAEAEAGNSAILDQIIEDGKKALENANWLKDDDAYNSEEEYQEAVRAAQDKINNPAKYLAEYSAKAQAANAAVDTDKKPDLTPEELEAKDILTRANWYAEQDLAQREMAAAIAKGDPAALDWLERHPMFKEDMDKLIQERNDNLKKAELEGDKNWEAFYAEKAADEEFRKYFGSQEAFDNAIRQLYEDELNRKADDSDKIEEAEQRKRTEEIGRMMEEDGDDVEEEKKGLFSKIKGFFGRSKRAKQGKKNAVGGLRGLKKAFYSTMLGVCTFVSLVSCGIKPNQNLNQLPQEPVAQATEYVENTDGAQNDAEAQRQEQLLQKAAEQKLNVVDMDAEEGEKFPETIKVMYDGEEIEINTTKNNWDGESTFYDEVGKEMGMKSGRYNLTAMNYDVYNTDEMNADTFKEAIENVYGYAAEDISPSGQYALLAGQDFLIDGDTDGITSVNEMNEVAKYAMSDEGNRQLFGENSHSVLDEVLGGEEAEIIECAEGSSHGSLYGVDIDGTFEYHWSNETTPADAKFYAVTTEKLNSNEAGGYKDRFLRAVGVIPEGASEEEAQKIMDKYDMAISLKCGQVIIISVDNHSGDESAGNESAGNESAGNESAGNESAGDESAGNESAGNESAGNESAGNESAGNESAGNESAGNESVGNESAGNESAGNESVGDESAGNESVGNESVGDESVGVETGDENISVGDESAGNESVGDESAGDETIPKTEETTVSDTNPYVDVLPVQDDQEVTRDEVIDTEDQTGPIDSQVTEGSSDSNTEGLMNGGDMSGTGEIPEEYSNDNTEWENGGGDAITDEAPAQTIEEERQTPEEIHEQNNSDADQDFTPDDSAEQGDRESDQLSDQDRANMMDDMF